MGLRVLAGLPGRGLLALEMARGQLVPLAPLCLGLGIALYFALPVEPAPLLRPLLWALVLGLGALAWRGPLSLRLPLAALALLGLGLVHSAERAAGAAAPVLSTRYYGPIEGRITGIDRSQSDALRVTLDQVVLPGRDPSRVPAQVRVSLLGPLYAFTPEIGARMGITGHLAPPFAPLEPGGFDYRRMVWFESLGGIGYSRNPPVLLAPPEAEPTLAMTDLRLRLASALRARIPGDAGGFVAAVLTGDRSGISAAATESLRRSSLYHIVSISGLHMALLCGAAYGGLRFLLALVPFLALRLPVHRMAAVGALLLATGYLLLAGDDVPPQRAYITAAVMLLAIILGRRALSYRSLAIAAFLVLLWRPDALLSAGFQMSFAATFALVAVFGLLRERSGGHGLLWRGLLGLRDAALVSLVAGLATAPFAAWHFNRVPEYGLLANMLGVPAMGLLVMPGALLSMPLWALGLEAPALWAMEFGARWILTVSDWVAGLEGAVRMLAKPRAFALPLLGLGALWLVLWPGRARLAGLAALLVALAGWGLSGRPRLLIAGDGRLVGLMGPEGRALSRASGGGMSAENWLEADGDAASPAEAARRPGFQPVEGGVAFVHEGQSYVHLYNRAGRAALARHCQSGITVIFDARHEGPPPGACQLLDAAALARTGALAAWPGDTQFTTARDHSGRRPWNPPAR